MTLRNKIEEQIRARGPMAFSTYMEMCLYDPEFGYYTRGIEQFGRAGDFYTSSDVHAVFGRLLARQFEEMWRALGSPKNLKVMELGPGRGLFARDVLDWSGKKFPEFFRAVNYVLVEKSERLRGKLRLTLDRHLQAGKVEIISGLEVNVETVPTICFGNEFFDALPVEVVSSAGLLHVVAKDSRLEEEFLPTTQSVGEYLDRYSVRPELGERVEAGLASVAVMQTLAQRIRHGFLVIVDYGYTQREQAAGRHRGTIMAYQRHSASGNPYEAPGEQDITAHVNFTALSSVAKCEGFQIENLRTQSQFLMGIGETSQFADAFEECRLPQEHAKVALQLKHLVTPVGMGEIFHVLVGSRNVSTDVVRKLSGLRFGNGK